VKDELPASNIQEFILWLLRKRNRFRVTGNSMLPWLQPGEEVLVNFSAYQNSLPEVGDLVVAIHPHRPNFPIIKRVAVVRENGDCLLLGDNPTESTDSRSFGTVSPQNILGKVTSRFI
jgi:nickel-type superoxide dismutase maturation protease